jgi:hypothetical protein
VVGDYSEPNPWLPSSPGGVEPAGDYYEASLWRSPHPSRVESMQPLDSSPNNTGPTLQDYNDLFDYDYNYNYDPWEELDGDVPAQVHSDRESAEHRAGENEHRPKFVRIFHPIINGMPLHLLSTYLDLISGDNRSDLRQGWP